MLRRRVTSLLCLFLLCLLAIPCAYGAEAETEQGVALERAAMAIAFPADGARRRVPAGAP